MSRAWITWTGLAVVAAAAAVLSFDALRQLAVLAGTPAGLAWLLPVTVDAAALVATRLWLAGAEGARRFARTLALTLIGASVAGNATSHALVAYQVVPPWWAVVAVAAVPPAVLGAVAHLAALAVPGALIAPSLQGGSYGESSPSGRPVERSSLQGGPFNRDEAGRITSSSLQGGTGEPSLDRGAGERSDMDTCSELNTTLVDRARYLVAAGEAEGVKVGRGRLARELGVSENQARRLLEQLAAERRPALRVAGGEAR